MATTTAQRIANALVDWWDENGGVSGPHAGSMFDDTRTWNDAVHAALADADQLAAERALANAAASFRAICEYLDGVCAHKHGEGRDCYVCDAYNSAQRGQLAAAAALDGKE